MFGTISRISYQNARTQNFTRASHIKAENVILAHELGSLSQYKLFWLILYFPTTLECPYALKNITKRIVTCKQVMYLWYLKDFFTEFSENLVTCRL